ncbi:13995_t:CDS:10 [Racocetra fulgida]|uniref:13995_t:CDS:1 n=1 Tax=Racocetra fulgida TaxID=60492 RepID=A0A9N8Z3U2_9GLOM|nr:13995_t:CDS:10 [Racocetra fulgida]
MKGKTFKPGEPYTHRLNKILDEYPDGSQILREILQNSDDSKSRSQTFLLDHNTYPTNKLIEPILDGYSKSNLKLDRYQGPALLSRNDAVFEERDFESLLRLANSEKRDQFDKIGDAEDSEISKNKYNPTKILNMFDKFYENESINCLLFLKSVESIKFFELKENESVPKLLYSIEIVNAKQIRKKRGLIAERIVSLMKELGKKKLSGDTKLESVFTVTFRQQKSDKTPRESHWIIFCWLGDLNVAANYFHETFKRKIIDYKLIPNVGIAVQLNNPEAIGRLFCFLPLPILMPFRVSVHGHFAVSTNRRSLWSATDGEDLAEGTLAKLKVSWNQYLFNVILPQAWAKFLVHLPNEAPDINAEEFYSFWPIIKESGSGGFVNNQTKNILLNTIENFTISDKVFCGPPRSCTLGNMSGILPSCQKVFMSRETAFHLFSIENSFLPDESASPDISKIIESIGFPIINIDPKVYDELKKSCHKNSLNICSPHAVRMYLLQNKSKWENKKREDVIALFEYVLSDKDYAKLDGLKMIPLSDETFGTISHLKKYFGFKPTSKDFIAYIGPDKNNSIDNNDERKIFANSLNKFIDKNIPSKLWNLLYEGAQEGWDLNIKILDPSVVANMITKELNGYSVGCNEIPLCDSCDWIYKIWANLKERDYDLTEFEDIHLLPTNSGNLRKLKTNQKCFWNSVNNKLNNDVQPLIERFGIVFVDKQFEKLVTYDRSKYCFIVNTFPKNVQIKLQPQEAEIIANYLRCLSPDTPTNYVVKHLPIFSEVGKDALIALEPSNRNWYLLPCEDEKSYGQIIAPNTEGFIDATTHNKRFLLENIIKVKRLSQQEYWTKFVIPYLGSQTLETIEIVIIRLFERLQLLSENQHLKYDLGNIEFIPATTILNVHKKEIQNADVKLKKPTDLFDPDNYSASELFFDDEYLFPAKNFSEKFRDNFLISLKTLGMKPYLSSTDIIQRINIFAKRKDNETNIVHQKSLKLVKYIDRNYDKLLGTNQRLQARYAPIIYNELTLVLQTKEWIPTVDSTGKKKFSRASDCRSIMHKNLVGLVMPIIDYTFDNRSFIKNLKWESRPPVDAIIAQLNACLSMKTINENTFKICEEVYKYMNDEMYNNSNLVIFKEKLKDKKWIFCNDKFYSSHRVVMKLDKNLDSKASLIVELPYAFRSCKELFKEMGVRQKIDIPDLISIIKEFHSTDSNTTKTLSNEELHKVVSVIELIVNRINEQRTNEQSDSCENLKDLLVPSTDCLLVNLHDIYYDDMKTRLDDDEKNELKIVHSLIAYSVAKTLGIKMLAGKFIDSNKWFNFLNITSDKQNSLLSDEMDQWQGPALWIYNDSEFSQHDFESLKKLGMGGKRDDKTKIGRFGIGFNCAYHLTDFPSFVSGEHIVFFDPLEKFLPKTGNPPRSPRGTKINFIEKDFRKRFEDQALPYLGIFDCELKEKFKGTLFRLPLRTSISELSNQVIKPKDLRSRIFENIQGNREMLFLRNIEQCSLFQMNLIGNMELIWETKIQNMNDEIRGLRISHSWEARLYQLEMEMYCRQSRFYKNGKYSEMWLICSGGSNLVDKSRFREISKEINLSVSGVAALLSVGDGKSLEELKAEKVYSYLSLPMLTSLGVHINGTFCLSSDRKNVLQDNNDLLTAETKEGEWNRYILLDVLPPLHSKLLDHIANHLMSPFNDEMFSQLWPIKFSTTDIYREYGLNVLRGLYLKRYKVFWTEANGGALTSLDKAYFVNSNDSTIADIFITRGKEIVKLSQDQMSHLNQMFKKMEFSSINLITPNLVSHWLRNDPNILDTAGEKLHEIAFRLLNFIIQAKDYKQLVGLQLLPLCDKSLGTFCSQTYYIAELEIRKLFPKAQSQFVADPPFDFQRIFKDENFRNMLQVKDLASDINSIIDLLEYVLPRDKEIEWDPNGVQYPNANWISEILKLLSPEQDIMSTYEFNRLARFPILSTCRPHHKLVLPNLSHPLLIYNSYHQMVPILAKFGVRFTSMKLPNHCNPYIKGCIEQPTAVNMIKSLERAIGIPPVPLKRLFSEKLDQDEFEKFRSFIKSEFINIQHDKSIKFLKTLPIWPTQSRSTCISAQEGIIPPQDIPFFSIREETNIFLIESELDFNVLFKLGAKYITPLEYVKEHLKPQNVTLDQQYIDFLKTVLSLEKREIENYLMPLKIIPNYHLTELVRGDTLYDINESLFRRIFWNTNKLLHPALQVNARCLSVLKRMGLKHQVNSLTFLECVREIDSKIKMFQSRQLNDQINLVKSDAKFLMEYLYEHLATLNFTNEQWLELISIKFVPVDTDLESPLKETAVRTTEFESINSMYYQEYKLLCWTQCPLFSKSVDPPNAFKSRFPNLCRPTLDKILDNLYYVALDISQAEKDSWKSPEGVQLILDILNKTYKTLEDWIKNQIYENVNVQSLDNRIISRLRTNARIFLNGNDPFIPEDWVAGQNLVFGAHEDVRTAASEYFETLFDGKMMEAAEHQKVTVDIDDIDPSAFRVLIRWLYGQELEEAISAVFKDSKCSDVFLVDLLRASDKYRIDPLKGQVEVKIIQDSYVNIDNAH